MLKINNYICTLDIGSSKISACVAEVKRKRISRVFFDNVASKGVRQGVIVDSIDLVSCIGKVIKNLKAKSGINIKFLYVNISGEDIITKHSRAIVPLAERGNKVITASDIERVNEQARVLGSSLEEEIIHRIPCSYTIDSKSNIINPIGLYSHRLEVDLYLVCAKLSFLQSLSRAINQAGLEIKNLFFSGLVTSRAAMNKELQEGINLFCDIGSDTTELLFFRDGLLYDIEILNVGGDDLTFELQEELKIPFDLAEDIKRSYGVIGDSAQIADDKEILVKKTHLYKPIKQKNVSEIITAKSKTLFSAIKNAVEKKVSCYEVNNFIVSGKSVLLEGFIEMLESTLAIPVKLARILSPDIPSLIKEDNELSGQKYLTYLTCIGMLAEALNEKPQGIFASQEPSKNPLLKVVTRFKEVYQEYF